MPDRLGAARLARGGGGRARRSPDLALHARRERAAAGPAMRTVLDGPAGDDPLFFEYFHGDTGVGLGREPPDRLDGARREAPGGHGTASSGARVKSVPEARPFIELGPDVCGDLDAAVRREWLVTNGLGGYAFGTVAGVATRAYHGLLVAALSPPVGRTMLVGGLVEWAAVAGGARRPPCARVRRRHDRPARLPAAGVRSPRGDAAGLHLRDRRRPDREARLDGRRRQHDLRPLRERRRGPGRSSSS